MTLSVTADELPRLMACNGSRLMPPAFPEIDADQTARHEGTAAHYMSQQAFNGVPFDRLIDTKAPNGFIMTAEMAEHVSVYLSALDCGEMEANTSWSTTGDVYQVRGRCDHRKWRPETMTLVIDDFKYGHRIVEPFEHWTLISHAVGSVFGGFTGGTLPQTVILRIHQPRPYHPDGKTREWRIDYPTLYEYYGRIHATLSAPSDALQTGPQCTRCHALGVCPAARLASMNAIDASTVAFSDAISNEALAWELDTLRSAANILESRLEALEELASHRIRTTGAVIPDHSLQPTYANTRWKIGMTAEVITALTGVNVTKSTLVTPAEAKRRNMPETVIKALTERPMTGMKLVRASADQQARRLLKR